MDIAINGRFLSQGVTGVQRYAREVVQAIDALLDRTSDVKVTVFSPRLFAPIPTWRNIVLRQVGYLGGHAWEQFELPWYSRGKLLFCPGNTAPIISLLGTQPVIATVHDLSYMYFPEAYQRAFRLWYGFLIPLTLKRARAVITVSESERRAIIAHYPGVASQLHAIANGGLPAYISTGARQSTSEGQNYILYVGSLSKRKNFPRLFEIACRLARQRQLQFVFVGSGSKSLVNSLWDVPSDISSQIIFVGAEDDPAALMTYYQEAGCLVFPSLYKSSGLPPVEAMACGCPVIASDIPALKERCRDAAIYCDPRDSKSIVAAIVRMMDDAELRSKLRTLGYLRAAQLTWEQCGRETLDLIVGVATNISRKIEPAA